MWLVAPQVRHEAKPFVLAIRQNLSAHRGTCGFRNGTHCTRALSPGHWRIAPSRRATVVEEWRRQRSREDFDTECDTHSPGGYNLAFQHVHALTALPNAADSRRYSAAVPRAVLGEQSSGRSLGDAGEFC